MKFTHDGNKTHVDGLVNFEKMHMLAQTMRTLRYCRARHLGEAEFSLITQITQILICKWRNL